MVKVCDAIMGTGKTSAAITYMNTYQDKKFIFITPYLAEASRIKAACPALEFVEPSDKLPEYHHRKSDHTAALIRQGRNVATTHQAFRGYNKNMLEDIRRQGYTLFIDENVEILEEFDIHPDDMKMAADAGYLKEENGVYSIVNTHYNGDAMHELFAKADFRGLAEVSTNGKKCFYWVLPAELITSFVDVFILTYLFEGQCIHHFLKIYDIPFDYVGVQKSEDGTFYFCDPPGYVPEYVTGLSDMIHIIDNPKMNKVGDDYYALSQNWFAHHPKGVEQLKKNINNCYKHIWKDAPASERMWGTFKREFEVTKGKGYTKSFLTFNSKATNAYRERVYLVYIANVYMNVNEKVFYMEHGIDVDEDMYALSIMVQWIWRSAVRDGQEIYIYIPSSRMRNLLITWMNDLSKGGGI